MDNETVIKNWYSSTTIIMGIAILILLMTVVYMSTFIWLYERYTSPDSYYSHGFLIPFVSGFFIWQKRKKLAVLPLKSSRVGLALIVIALLLHILSVWTHTFFTSGFSILILFFGLSLYLFGKEITKELLFPLSFLVFMFPLPMVAINAITFPLKMFVTKVATFGVAQTGIPILREGFQVHLANASLTIGNPCSGLRSLISFLALGSILAYWINAALSKKLLLFLFAIPVALASNIIRVVVLILGANYYGVQTASPGGFIHDASGIAVFIIGFICLITLWRLLECQD